MALGYSREVEQSVRGADQTLLGVQLGAAALDRDIPVAELARYFGVSRATIYNWFKGAVPVSSACCAKVGDLLQSWNTLRPVN